MIRLLLLVALLFVGLAGMGQPRATSLVAGEISWMRNSTCEWPPGTFLNYYVQGCRLEDQLFLAGGWLPADGSAAGSRVWATGRLRRNGGCLILEVDECQTCALEPGPAPDAGG